MLVIMGGAKANKGECRLDGTNERQARGQSEVYDRVLTVAGRNSGGAQAIPADC